MISLLAALVFPVIAGAQADVSNLSQQTQQWNGNWIAEGTLFQIQVSAIDGIMKVQEVESLGFIWTSKEGRIEGNIAQIEVEYAGVTGIIQAELIDAETAIAFASTCVPDFMVVCALAKDRQAVFRKVASDN